MNAMPADLAVILGRLSSGSSPNAAQDLVDAWTKVVGKPPDMSRPLLDLAAELAVIISVTYGGDAPKISLERPSRYRRAVGWLDGTWKVERWLVLGVFLSLTSEVVPWQHGEAAISAASLVLVVRGFWTVVRGFWTWRRRA